MTVSGMSSCSGWMFSIEDRVQGRRLIAVDYVEYDLLVVSGRYRRLHVCAYNCAYTGVVKEVALYRHAGCTVE